MGDAMDTQYLDATPAPAHAPDEGLTFHALYRRVQGLTGQSIYPTPGAVERWSVRVGAGAALLGLITGLLLDRWVPANVLLPFLLVCLTVEVGGFVISGVLMARREYRQYIQPRLSHAKEMDNEFGHWLAVVAELQRFPRREREQRLRFVTVLRASMGERMGLLYGGLQKLGPFPLLVALYVQYQSWKTSGWQGVFDVGWPGGILILSMVLLYVIGWMLIIQRARLDTYVNLLEASLHHEPVASSVID